MSGEWHCYHKLVKTITLQFDFINTETETFTLFIINTVGAQNPKVI